MVVHQILILMCKHHQGSAALSSSGANCCIPSPVRTSPDCRPCVKLFMPSAYYWNLIKKAIMLDENDTRSTDGKSGKGSDPARGLRVLANGRQIGRATKVVKVLRYG